MQTMIKERKYPLLDGIFCISINTEKNINSIILLTIAVIMPEIIGATILREQLLILLSNYNTAFQNNPYFLLQIYSQKGYDMLNYRE